MSRSWDTWDDDDDWPIESKTYTQAHNDDGGGGSDEDDGHEYTKSSLDSDDRNLGKALQNVFLSDTKNQKSEENFDDDDDDGEITEGGGSDGFNFEYPLRPYAEDCAFYLKTGTCKFKLACKFNHPLNRDFQGVKEKEGSVKETFNITCKYYVTAGGCKFGEACKFKHSKNENIMETPELNFLGLPIRLGEKECPFYMRTGSCAYGARCKFHHPDPTDLVTSDPEDEAQDDSLEKASDSWEDHAREPDPVPASTESQPAAEPWAPHMIMRQTALYLENRTSSSPEAGEDQSSKDWNEYQHMQTPTEETEQTTLNTQVNPSVEENDSPLYYFRPTEEIEQATLNAQVNNALEKDNGPLYYLRLVNVDEFPERPGQPKCSYYMKTGDCKFRSACRYHHPKNRYSKLHNGPLGNRHMNQNFFFQLENLWKDDLASEGDNLSDNTKILTYQQQRRSEEFPERPGQPECNYFIKTGDCKRRSSCRYHHPKNYHSTGCSLNNKGLPLRPGTQVCDYFKRFGICKFGRLCSFDHSEGLVSLNLSRRSTLMSHQEASL